MTLGPSDSRAQRLSCTPVCLQSPVVSCWLCPRQPALHPAFPGRPSPHLGCGLPSSGHPPLSSSPRRGPTGKPVHIRKFQPREPARARDSEQPAALEETETWLAGGGVVTGDLRSHHFLGFPECTQRSQQLRDTRTRCEPLPRCQSHAPLRGRRAADRDGEYENPGEGRGVYALGVPSAWVGGMWSKFLSSSQHHRGLCGSRLHTHSLWASVPPGIGMRAFQLCCRRSSLPFRTWPLNLLSPKPPVLPSLPLR